MLHAAKELRDLLSPPGNRLEKLKGELEKEYSLRINDQWRIVFRFAGGNAEEVRVEDYHRRDLTVFPIRFTPERSCSKSFSSRSD